MKTLKKAVIVGGGFSALVTARVLADYFDEVVIYEKDGKLGSHLPRSGAPQGAHLHVLLQKGQKTLRSLFPGIEQVFIENNCPVIDWAADTKWETRSGAFPNHTSTIRTYSFSRPFIEGVVHDLLLAHHPNVSIVETQATQIRINNRTVHGLELSNGEICDSADLYVLAGGQNFPLERFLSNLNADIPTEEYPIAITYYSTFLETPSVDLGDARQHYYQADPLFETTGSVICPIEHHRSVATLIEYGSKPQGNLTISELIRKAENIPGRKLAEVLKAQPAHTKVACFHKATMYRRRLDQMKTVPRNLIVVGDALCSLNPVFGQGMTSALIQVQQLKQLLAKNSTDRFNSRVFHRNSIRELSTPFLMSKIGSASKPNPSLRYLHSYLAKSRVSIAHHRRFLDVLHLNRPISALIDPAVALESLQFKFRALGHD